ncbi:MAG TPA: magnesium transporter CorA family protein [Candidatus Limnocylindrales bacterium]|jgi:magnesium transporter
MQASTPTSISRSSAAPDPAGEDGMVVRGCSFAGGASRPFSGMDELKAILADPEALVWVDVAASGDVPVDPICSLLELHPLIATDINERNQRAKVAEVEGTIHVVMFWIAFEAAVEALEIDIVLGKRLLLTVHEPAWDPFELQQLRGDGTSVLKRGVDFMLYAITDGIVDGYFPVLDAIEDEIDEIQDAVIARPTTWTLERLFTLKRELISLRRAISPSREIFNQLTNRDQALIAPDHIVYFRDVYDHLIRVTDELDTDRELVAGTLEVYLSTVNNNLSTIMKRLTGVTVILAGIGAVAGIFGMSEAGTALSFGEGSGFWIITGFVVIGAALTAMLLRKIDWI